jgi:hypothetical protein
MNEKTITQDMLEGLPEPAKRYLHFTGVVGTPWISATRLTQKGKFRQGADRPWMTFSAIESYTTDPPSFRWDARFKMFGLPLLRAVDQFERGHGSMSGVLLGLKTIFDVSGDKMDQGSMMRYLNEMIWFPTAFLSQNVRWEEVDDRSAKVIFSVEDKEDSAILHFDKAGRLTNFTAKRYREIDGEFSLDDWSTPISSYGEHAGLQIPISGAAVWHLPEGDLCYIDLEIKKIEYRYDI